MLDRRARALLGELREIDGAADERPGARTRRTPGARLLFELERRFGEPRAEGGSRSPTTAASSCSLRRRAGEAEAIGGRGRPAPAERRRPPARSRSSLRDPARARAALSPRCSSLRDPGRARGRAAGRRDRDRRVAARAAGRRRRRRPRRRPARYLRGPGRRLARTGRLVRAAGAARPRPRAPTRRWSSGTAARSGASWRDRALRGGRLGLRAAARGGRQAALARRDGRATGRRVASR